MLYLAIFGFLLVLRYVRSRRGQYYYLLLIALFLFSAFRLTVGCDWFGYLNQFRVYDFSEFSDVFSSREPSWLGLFVLQHKMELPYPWINVFSSLIFFVGAHFLARRQPDPLAFLILLFPVLIINMPMSGIRQASAIGVLCLAFNAFVDRALIRYVLLVVLASTLHSSAIVFLLLAPLVTGGYSWQRLVLAGMIAIPGGLALLSRDDAAEASSRYIATDTDAAGALFRVGLLFATALFFFFQLRKRWAATFPADYKLVSIGSIMMTALIVLLPTSSVISDRLGYYLIPIQTIILARLPFLPIRNNRKFIIAAPYMALAAVFLVWTSLSSHFQGCYVPYDSWLLGFPQDYPFLY